MYQLDHIVHFVNRPEDALTYFKDAGLHVVIGGNHEAWGTYNALSYFDLTYIEFIGIYDEQLFQMAAKQKYTLHESYEKNKRQNGFTRIALSTTCIEKDAINFQKAGFDVIGPEAFSRKRQDGSVVSWKLLHIGHQDSTIELPFFIQWDQSTDFRRSEYTRRGIISNHPLGALQLQAVYYYVPNLKFVEQFAKLCDGHVEMKKDDKLQCEIGIVSLTNAKIIFYHPIGEGMIMDETLEGGYGIRKVTFSGANEQQQVINYDGALYEVRE